MVETTKFVPEADGYRLLLDRRREERLMSAVDSINNRLETGAVCFAAEGLNRSWRLKEDNLTPAYTTRWSDIPVVK